MADKVTISTFEVTGKPFCVNTVDGQKVYERISFALRQGATVVLSFRNVNVLTPTFLNVAIGQLYGEFTHEQIKSLLELQDIKAKDLSMLKRVVKNAKAFFNGMDVEGT